jgi:hypothetical protein
MTMGYAITQKGIDVQHHGPRRSLPGEQGLAGHRARGGAKTGVLPDFFVGAHAAVEHRPLLTRDARRIAPCFPTVQLISP